MSGIFSSARESAGGRRPSYAGGRQPSYFAYGLLLVLVVWAVDQGVKHSVMTWLAQIGGYYRVNDFFNVVTVWNRGMAFGLFGGGTLSVGVLIGLAGVVTGVLVVCLWRARGTLAATGWALAIGGALGNITDRGQFGAVFDFLDFHVGGWHWPAFNIADCAVVTGVGIIAFLLLTEKTPTR